MRIVRYVMHHLVRHSTYTRRFSTPYSVHPVVGEPFAPAPSIGYVFLPVFDCISTFLQMIERGLGGVHRDGPTPTRVYYFYSTSIFAFREPVRVTLFEVRLIIFIHSFTN